MRRVGEDRVVPGVRWRRASSVMGILGGGGWDRWNYCCSEWDDVVLVGDQSDIARLYSI